MNQNKVFKIPKNLSEYVKHICVLNSDSSNTFSIFADGCPGIIFQNSTDEIWLDNKKKLSQLFLYGQTINPISLNTEKNCELIVMILQPHILKTVFGFNANEVTDNCLDLRLVPSASRLNLAEQLGDCVNTDAQVAILSEFLSKIIYGNNIKPDSKLQYASNLIMNSNGSVDLKGLQTKLNLSERTFERKFEQHLGISPKTLSIISQFQASLSQIKSNHYSKLSDVAFDNGYADQSHFIRTFKKFTGFSPNQYSLKSDKIVDSFKELML
jgi:AraC-like DNA-binding protein